MGVHEASGEKNQKELKPNKSQADMRNSLILKRIGAMGERIDEQIESVTQRKEELKLSLATAAHSPLRKAKLELQLQETRTELQSLVSRKTLPRAKQGRTLKQQHRESPSRWSTLMSRHEKCIFRRFQGGLGSNPALHREVYFMGIIDALQTYNYKKRLESGVKGLVYGRSTISAVPAAEYGQRFLGFLSGLCE